MNFRDTLFFIGMSLGLRSYPERIAEIRKVLQSGSVNWERLVWISSSYLVLPALFVQLRDSKLLNELPVDLVDHLDQLHKTNTVRNRAIMTQVEDITDILHSNSIKPIFIKGIAHQLDELYRDPGERMIGDIDFLVAENEVFPTVELLKELAYSNSDLFYPDMLNTQRHFPRLINPDLLGGVEVHWQSVSKPYSKKFSFELIGKFKKSSVVNPNAYVQSYNHQIIQSMMNLPMHNKILHFGSIDVKHLYDLFLLSQRADTLEAISEFGYYTKHFDAQLKTASEIFGEPPSIRYNDSMQAVRYYRRLDFLFSHPKWYSFIGTIQFILLHLKQYISLPLRAIYSKSARRTLVKRLSSRSWYKRHFGSYRALFKP